MTQAGPKVDPADGNRAGWRDTVEADPLGLATRKQWEEEGPPKSRSTQRRDLLRLLAVVAGVIILGFAAGYGETVLLVVALIGCIVAHEFGHYLAARTGNVKVTEFFVGFGPRLWSIRRGETEYGVKGIPLGGYCRIVGMNNLEEVDPADEARTYRSAPLWRHCSIDVAGSSAPFHHRFAGAVLHVLLDRRRGLLPVERPGLQPHRPDPGFLDRDQPGGGRRVSYR